MVTSRRVPTVSAAWLLGRFLKHGLRGFRVLRSAEAPLIRYHRDTDDYPHEHVYRCQDCGEIPA